MITLQQILNMQSNILDNKTVKIVRHKDERKEFRHLLNERKSLLEYQREQQSDIFKDCDYIISFVGTDRRRSIFLGVFQVNGYKKKNQKYYYNLTPVSEFEPLVDRLVINWGASTRSWHQWYHLHQKEIIEIRPKGFIGNFPGLLNFVLEYNDLQELTNHPEANWEWQQHLSSVNGVYLILDSNTGKQYVGSAYGKNGIWQRWCYYAQDPTGGNKELRVLMKNDPSYFRYFRFSILQTLPSNITADEIIGIEKLYKGKLGSKLHGLNCN